MPKTKNRRLKFVASNLGIRLPSVNRLSPGAGKNGQPANANDPPVAN
ncbi:MAG TPA: hypothetical protein VK400_11745 [Pyrinomonadaceae bacterium]|nr:hypothetical protein [Pyrinomonadaceae bacterium]